MPRPQSKYRPKQEVTHRDGLRTGVLVRKVFTYPQWMVRLPDGKITWWWEADFTLRKGEQ